MTLFLLLRLQQTPCRPPSTQETTHTLCLLLNMPPTSTCCPQATSQTTPPIKKATTFTALRASRSNTGRRVMIDG